MKVLHVIDTLWLGGAQTLIKSLIEVDPNVLVYNLRKTEKQVSIPSKNVINDSSKNLYSIGRIIRLLKAIKKNQITVLHCHLPHSHVLGILIKCFFLRRLKLLIHDHSDIYENGLRSSILKMIYRVFHNVPNKIITVSKGSKNKLVFGGGFKPSKIEILYNFPSQNISKENSSSGSIFCVGFAGRIEERKGWRFVLDLATKLQNHSTINFRIVGEGSESELLNKEILKRKLTDSVVYSGYENNMNRFYNQVDVVIFPSKWEGFSIGVLECLKAGVPIIINDVEGLNEIANPAFMGVCEEGDINDYLHFILKLKEEKKTREFWISKGKELASTFTAKNYHKELQKIYSSL